MEIQMICFDDYLQWHTLPWWSLLELETCLHIFCTTKWLIWGILSVDPSIRIQKPKQGVLWYLWTWGTQKHHTKFWDVQKRSSRGEENFCKKGKVKKGKERRANFCTSLTLELFGAVFSLYDGHFQCFLLGMKWRICSIALHKQGLFLTSWYLINNAEQVSMERSREFRARHCPVIPSSYRRGCTRPHWGSDFLKDIFTLQNI